MNCPLFLFEKRVFQEQEVSGGSTLSSSITPGSGVIHSHFPAALAEHGGKAKLHVHKYGCG